MSKIPCDVIKDLLPLYKDDVCSEKSKDMIEEHLPECEDCRNYLEAMSLELPPVTPQWSEEDGQKGAFSGTNLDISYLKKIAQKMNWLKVVLGVSAFVITAMTVGLIKYFYTEYLYMIPAFDKRMALEDIRLTELYQLEDGRLYFTLETDTLCQLPPVTGVMSPDALAPTESYDNGEIMLYLENASFLDRYLFSRPSSDKFSYVVPLEEEYRYEEYTTNEYDADMKTAVRTAVHKAALFSCVGKGGEKLTLWKKGQKLEAAPSEVEKKVQAEQERNLKYADEIDGADESQEELSFEDDTVIICDDLDE